MHAIISRNNEAILISRDKDFKSLKDIVESIVPEELVNALQQ